MSEISGNAKTRGMTPDVLENIQGSSLNKYQLFSNI